MAGPGIHPYHQQWPQQPPPPPVPHQTPGPANALSSAPVPIAIENPNRLPTEEVRTVFISGLPEDVKDRELHNLLRWLPGFEASQVNYKGEQPMGFALFSNAQLAMAARDALQDMIFDAEPKCVLHTEMAKKNLFVKRGAVVETNALDQSKRMRTGGDYTNTGYPGPSPFHHPPPPPQPVWGHQGYMASAPPPYDPYAGYPMPPVPMPTPTPVPAPTGYAPVQNAKDNPPCNTLFIGNLGENTIEDELRSLFSVQLGFKQMKVLRQERNTDVNSATNVHQNLQGAVIPSSGRGGMRIQYSKNPFGRRKDGVTGPPIANGAVPMLTYQYGEIVDVNLVRDKATGKSKGFAFVAYEDQRSTNLAVDNLNGASVLGRIIRVDHVTNYKKKEEEDEEEAQKKREARGVCRAFQRGQCNRGSACKFSHDEQRCANTGWGGKDSEPNWEHDKANIPPKPIRKEDRDLRRDERPIRHNSEQQTNGDHDKREERIGRRELETNPRKSRDRRGSDVETNPRRDHDRRGGDMETNPRRDHDRRVREERSRRHDSERNEKDYSDRKGGEKRSRYDRDSSSQHHREEDERRNRRSHKL